MIKGRRKKFIGELAKRKDAKLERKLEPKGNGSGLVYKRGKLRDEGLS